MRRPCATDIDPRKKTIRFTQRQQLKKAAPRTTLSFPLRRSALRSPWSKGLGQSNLFLAAAPPKLHSLICRVVDHARRSAHSADDELFARLQAALTSEPVSPLQHWLNDSITSSHLYLIWFGLSRARSHGSKPSARLAPLGSPLPTRTQLRATVVYFAPHEAHMHVAIMCARSSPKLIPA